MVKIRFDILKEEPKCIICGKGHKKENALQLLPGGKHWTHKDCDGRGMSIFPFGKQVGL